MRKKSMNTAVDTPENSKIVSQRATPSDFRDSYSKNLKPGIINNRYTNNSKQILIDVKDESKKTREKRKQSVQPEIYSEKIVIKNPKRVTIISQVNSTHTSRSNSPFVEKNQNDNKNAYFNFLIYIIIVTNVKK